VVGDSMRGGGGEGKWIRLRRCILNWGGNEGRNVAMLCYPDIGFRGAERVGGAWSVPRSASWMNM